MEEEKRAMVEEPLLEEKNEKGGFKTLPFIIGNEAVEKMATYGLMSNMTLYLKNEYHMEVTTASNVLFLWSAATNFMPLLGAILADSYLGRFYTIGIGSIICFMGITLLWSTAIIPQARPLPCDQSSNTCSPPTFFHFAFICTALGLIAIGGGGIRCSCLAFGADQLEKANFQQRPGLKERYFGWYYATYTFSVLIALTVVVYIQDQLGWGVGFAVPAVLMLCGVILFFSASNWYVKVKSKTTLVSGFIQVVVASFRNRRLELSDGTNYVYHCRNGSPLVSPSEKLRFLNKACIIRDPEKNLTPDGRARNQWTLRTVDEVEDLKTLLRIVPIWLTGVIMAINMSQHSLPVLQANAMDRRVTSSFTIPAASFNMFTVTSVIVWVVLYDRVFLPLASRIKKRPVHITTRERMGIGIFISFFAMMVSATIEGFRRARATREGYSDQPMSAMWLVPQYCLNGFAEASNAIAQNEFYFSELPRSMSSVASSLIWVGMALANLIASLIMTLVDSISKARGGESWVSSNINKGHYDYYYLVLAGLSMANIVYFLVCSRAYGPLKEERQMAEHEDEF